MYMLADRRLKYTISLITILLSLGLADLSNAGAEQPVMKTIIGEIKEIGDDYLIIRGIRVDLVDMEHRGSVMPQCFDA